MDKKALITALKKYHFWAALGVAIVLVLGIYFVVSGPSLAEQTDRDKATLKSIFDSQAAIASVENHPNGDVTEDADKETEKLKGNVLEAWESLYGDQRANNQLPEILKNVDNGGFNEAFEKLMTGEATTLARRYLETYQGFIITYVNGGFDKLNLRRDVVDPNATGTEGAGGGAPAAPGGLGGAVIGGGPAAASDKKKEGVKRVGLVDWEVADRQKIITRFQWTSVPTTGKVLLAQEDLWVYEALMRIILNTNQETPTGSTAVTYENVPVRRIHTLQIAEQVSGMVATGGDADADEGDDASDDTGAEQDGSQPRGPVIDYPEGRYVDDSNEPLGPDDSHPFAEYKIMPIRMQLDIDQRMIPKLLAECDGSKMPVEVKRIRLNPGAGRDVRLKLSAAGDGGKAEGGGMMRQPDRGGEAGRKKPDGAVRTGMYITIEILGVIYIYNPPDEDQLGTGTVAEEAAGEGTEETTPPDETPEAADDTAKTGPGQPSLVDG
ncbi:MAG: hypothetical protein HQ567_13685 [Candidatus Nealsonbacteria bacterium]|nr:hypothetical protein [Candidatus Nealsonbacteria bacterium]